MCKSCPPCLWEKSWWCCCWVVCSLQCAGVLLVKVYDWQECVSRAKWAFTLSEQGGGCCVRNMCPIFLCDITGHCVHSAVTHHQHHHQHLPSGGAGRRAGAAEAGEEGWAGRGGVWEVCWCFFVFFFLSAWTKFCHVVYKITCFSFSMCVNVTRVYFAGVGRQSPWTAAAATAQRSLLPAQRGCVQRASASPPEGAVNRPPANSPRWRWSLQQWRCGAAYSLTL